MNTEQSQTRHLEVQHTTTYSFAAEVFLEPHTLLLHPKTSMHSRIRSFDLKVDPVPAGSALFLDACDNPAHHVWFDGMTRSLVVEAHSEIIVLPIKPLDFLIYPFDAGKLGFSYSPQVQSLLDPYLAEDADDRAVNMLARDCRKKYGDGTIDFIVGSTEFVHQRFERIARLEGAAMPPRETIGKGRGSCRDLTRLHMSMMRSAGLAARFVSGYLYLGAEAEQHELHAWTEIYVPGGGWIGADPTIGLLAGEGHIRLATAHTPHLTLPVQGTYRGDASVQLEASLEMVSV